MGSLRSTEGSLLGPYVEGDAAALTEVVVENERSKAIPERLSFRQEAVRREAKLIEGRFEDAVLYAMVASDWSASPAREAIGSE